MHPQPGMFSMGNPNFQHIPMVTQFSQFFILVNILAYFWKFQQIYQITSRFSENLSNLPVNFIIIHQITGKFCKNLSNYW